MASVSGTTSSLGNTSLRGFGGLVSGLNRDELIEQMTAGTQNKITTQKTNMTKLEWKQEAFQSLSSKIIGLEDNYFSYSSSTCLKNPNLFSRSLITAIGNSDVTKFVSASGTSDMIDHLAVLGVKQLASSAVRRSDSITNGTLKTGFSNLDDTVKISNLRDSQLRFGVWLGEKEGFNQEMTFTFGDTYTDDKGDKHTIDYTSDDVDYIIGEMNNFLKYSSAKLGGDKIGDVMEFSKAADGTIQITEKKHTNFVIKNNSSALSAMGYKTGKDNEDEKDGISFDEFNAATKKAFADSYISRPTALEFFKDKKMTVDYNGSKKDIELITKEEYEEISKLATPEEKMNKMAEGLQKRLDQAFGKGKITVGKDAGVLSFATGDSNSTVSISSKDSAMMDALGLVSGASNKLNVNASLDKANLAGIGSKDDLIGAGYADASGNLLLKINGVDIKGLTVNSSLSQIMNKINSTKDAGVKASYVESTGQLILVSSETGAGREINVEAGNGGSALAEKLFGSSDPKNFVEGQDAIIMVGYGNGMEVEMNRSSNTFSLEGLSVSVTGTFGYKEDGTLDSSQKVTFSAKADVDKATETVKKFFEEYNALVTEVNKHITTKPDSSYGPLTDAQKDEMTEKEIERWEEKAKQGLLFNNGTLRDMSMSMQGIFTQMLQNGISYEDLEEIGITPSSNYFDGGTITFDETKFRQAMESDPDKVNKLFTGGDSGAKGIAQLMDDQLTPYATRYSYKNRNLGGDSNNGRLILEAGSDLVPTSLTDNYIYKEIESVKEVIQKLQERLKTEEDRYISQFTYMESMINQMNSQSSYLSSLTS